MATVTEAVNITFSHVGDSSTFTAGILVDGKGWRIPSDGLDGFARQNVEYSSTEYASIAGAKVDGVKLKEADRTITLVYENDGSGNSLELIRNDAYRFFEIGLKINIKLNYNGSVRVCSGYVSKFKISEGNIYDSLTLTLTIMCADPYMSDGVTRSYKYTSGGITISKTETAVGDTLRFPYKIVGYAQDSWRVCRINMIFFPAIAGQKTIVGNFLLPNPQVIFPNTAYIEFDTSKRPLVAQVVSDGAKMILQGFDISAQDKLDLYRGRTVSVALQFFSDLNMTTQVKSSLDSYMEIYPRFVGI